MEREPEVSAAAPAHVTETQPEDAGDAFGEPEHVEPLDLSAITAPSDVTPPDIETPRDALATPVEPLTSRRSDAKSDSSARSSGKKEKTVRFSEQVLVEEFVTEEYDDDVIEDEAPAYGAEDNYDDDFENGDEKEEGGAFSEGLVSTLDLLNTGHGTVCKCPCITLQNLVYSPIAHECSIISFHFQ